MQKVSYIYSGENQTFHFNFPYFEKSNIVVTVDNKPAPAYNVIGNKSGLNSDFPFTSGRIVFVKPLKMFQTITIERHLPYNRPVDFQPTAKITPMDLNLDMNNTIELLKDLKDEVDDLRNKYKDITDKEQIDLLLEKIGLVNQNIADISEHMVVFDRIPLMQTAIESLQSTVATLSSGLSNCTNSIDLLDTRTTSISDYVIDYQSPSSENNYTWYRKYKSGWVEQGGVFNGTYDSYTTETVLLQVTMADTNYCGYVTSCAVGSAYTPRFLSKTTTSVVFGHVLDIETNAACWVIMGMAATAA